MFRPSKLVTLTLLLSLWACAPQLPASHAGLTNEGVLLLSSDNPYLGTNRFLAAELEKSSVLLNFMRQRGGPQAMKVTKPRFGGLTIIFLFYPKERQYYSAEIDESARKNPRVYEDWVIKGPFQTTRQDFRVLRQMVSESAEPVFILHGENYQFKVTNKPEQKENRATEVFAHVVKATPKPTPTPELPKEEKTPVTPEDAIDLLITAPPGKFRALNTDELAIAMSKGYAEREPNGDAVHSVRFDGESIDAVVKWYSGDLANKSAILQANKFPDDIKLKGGDRVIIPFSLLKNLHMMPSDYYVEE